MNITQQSNMKKDQPQVFVRVRPSQSLTELRVHQNTVIIPSSTYDRKDKIFEYNRVFDSKTTNIKIWEDNIIQETNIIQQGKNLTLLSYGATGSGKTHTIFGNQQEKGIAFLLFQKLLEDYKQYQFRFSFFEIYNENIKDLLNQDQSTKLLLLEEKNKTIITNITEPVIQNFQELQTLILAGILKRSESATTMNEVSSRSHAILQLSTSHPVTKLKSKITIIDLAGSQKTLYNQSSKQVIQGSNINKSLLALGNCLNILSDNHKKCGYVPYRDSKLTRILKDSLSGSARLIMIACISGNRVQYEETTNTLNYASRASKIKWVRKEKQQIANDGCGCSYREKWEESQKCVKNLQQKISSIMKQIKSMNFNEVQNKFETLLNLKFKQSKKIPSHSQDSFDKMKRQILAILNQYRKISQSILNNFQSSIFRLPRFSQLDKENRDQSINFREHKSTSIFSKKTSSESYFQQDQNSSCFITQRMKRDLCEGNRIMLKRVRMLSPRTFR